MDTKNKKALLTVALGSVALLMVCSLSTRAQEQDSLTVSRLSMISADLGISLEQATAVSAIIDLDKTKTRELVKETYQQLSVKLQALAAERDQALKELLSADQFAKILQALRREDLWSPEGRPLLSPIR